MEKKTFKETKIGAFLASKAPKVLQALGDVLFNIPRLIKQANRLSKKEVKEYLKLPEIKLYWEPLKQK